MAENIDPTQPLAPTLPVKPTDKDQHNKKKHDKHNQKHKDKTQSSTDRPHRGLFDEYV